MNQNPLEQRRQNLIQEKNSLLDERYRLRAEIIAEEAKDKSSEKSMIIARGEMSAGDFVEKSLVQQELSYEHLMTEMRKKAPPNTRPALDNLSGKPIFATEESINNNEATPL